MSLGPSLRTHSKRVCTRSLGTRAHTHAAHLDQSPCSRPSTVTESPSPVLASWSQSDRSQPTNHSPAHTALCFHSPASMHRHTGPTDDVAMSRPSPTLRTDFMPCLACRVLSRPALASSQRYARSMYVRGLCYGHATALRRRSGLSAALLLCLCPALCSQCTILH
ncbi:hypothetical protein B0I35DRAFT_429487 [Stachybotrys elegans]|uniref:Uncharacterized protein n=1 Tax=Stachybotrys elegans TaxID=80388 RepID=A0A8K0SPX2_9HYPO|nr:hypothetical protein B0I35DRAFT_429487 [Stachybotrys elegans]